MIDLARFSMMWIVPVLVGLTTQYVWGYDAVYPMIFGWSVGLISSLILDILDVRKKIEKEWNEGN